MSEIGVTSFATYDEWMKMERPKVSPHQVTRDFEQALCEYTGARFAVTTTSCTQAVLMALAWYRPKYRKDDPPQLGMPKLSYVGVPAAILNAGFGVFFYEDEWQGEYEIGGTGVWDSARRFTSGMFRPGAMQCVSFHASKILGDSQGGAILHDDPEADSWLRRARFDGRTEGVDPKEDQVTFPSWHAYMSPDVAARLLWRLSVLPKHNADLPRSDYPDLSTLKAFQ
jgi:dTDP-4-amino-4,6-dideoxygalactose transaminase